MLSHCPSTTLIPIKCFILLRECSLIFSLVHCLDVFFDVSLPVCPSPNCFDSLSQHSVPRIWTEDVGVYVYASLPTKKIQIDSKLEPVLLIKGQWIALVYMALSVIRNCRGQLAAQPVAMEATGAAGRSMANCRKRQRWRDAAHTSVNWMLGQFPAFPASAIFYPAMLANPFQPNVSAVSLRILCTMQFMSPNCTDHDHCHRLNQLYND